MHLGQLSVGQVGQLRVYQSGKMDIQSGKPGVGNGELVMMTATPNGLTYDIAGATEGASVGTVYVLRVTGNWVALHNTGATGSANVFQFAPTFKTDGVTARRIGPQNVYTVQQTIDLSGTSITGNPSAIGMFFSPTYSRSSGSGTATAQSIEAIQTNATFSAGWTISNVVALHVQNPTGTASVFTTQSAIEIENLTGATDNLSLFSAGAAVTMRHAGSAIFGGTQTYPGTAPSARLHVSEPTAAAEVLRIEAAPAASTTTDKPAVRFFEISGQSTSTTAVVLPVFTTASNTVYSMEFACTGRCVSGAGCTAGQAVAVQRFGVFKNVSGTLSTITGVTVGAEPLSMRTDLTSGTTTNGPCTVTYCGGPICNAVTPAACSGTTISIQVKGVAATQTIDWHCTAQVQGLSS